MSYFPDWTEIQRKRELARTLIDRLNAGDDLHKEAAAEILRLRQEVKEWSKEAQNANRDAYAEGRLAGQEEAERERW